MQLPWVDVGALTEPGPFDPVDPATPAVQGWHSQSPLAPSELRPEAVNDVVGEIVRLGITGGLIGPHRDELRQIFRNDDLPDKEALPMVDLVSTADIVSQVGQYKRAGTQVFMTMRAEWANTNAAIDAEPLRFHLPYEAAQESIGRLSITRSTFRLDNPGGANQAYEPVIQNAPSSYVAMWRGNELGAAPVPVPIGDSVADGGNRIALFHILYKTTNIRNTAWPYIEWYSLTHTPVNPGPTIAEYRYDGALNNDLVELLTFPGLVVQNSHNLIAPPPSGRGSFTISDPGMYALRIRGLFLSRNVFTVNAI